MPYNGIEQAPELQAISMMLEKLDVPSSIQAQHNFLGTSYTININRIGLNPSMALQVFRTFGFAGIQHSAPTVYFWNTSGAPKEVCDDFKKKHGEEIFDMVQSHMQKRNKLM